MRKVGTFKGNLHIIEKLGCFGRAWKESGDSLHIKKLGCFSKSRVLRNILRHDILGDSAYMVRWDFLRESVNFNSVFLYFKG